MYKMVIADTVAIYKNYFVNNLSIKNEQRLKPSEGHLGG